MPIKRFDPKEKLLKPGAEGLEKRRILYVEDEDTNWELTEFSLRERFVLRRASDAAQCFAAVREERFDLILMDIQLSGSAIDGIDITRVLRGASVAKLPEYARNVTAISTPIIFVTAYTARYKREDLFSIGGNELITKPVNFTALMLAMSRLMLRDAMARLDFKK